MSSPIPSTEKPKTDWLAALLFALGGLGALSFLGSGLGGLFYGALELSRGNPAAQTFLSSAGLIFAGLVLLAPAGLALLRLMHKAPPVWMGRHRLEKRLPWLILSYPVVLLAGHLAAQQPTLDWLLLPPVHLLAATISLLGLLWVALRRLPFSALRGWGALATGMTLSPLLAFSLEAIAGAAALIAGTFYVALQPELARNLDRLFTRLSYGNPSLESLQGILEPIAADPVVLIGVFGFIALLVPLIEELVKPIGVWLLIRRPLTPSDGFALGVLGGAGFGLLENLLQGASAEGWLPLVIARLGTMAVHMITGGFTGWAIVLAKNEKRYLRLLGAYLLSVAIHGVWNALALAVSLGGLSAVLPDALSVLAGIALFALGVGCVLLLVAVNRKLRLESRLRREIELLGEL